MKKSRLLSISTLVVLVSLLLSGCGGTMINGWPGVSTNQDVVYLSFQGAVYAVNAQSGSLIWQFPKEKPDPSKPFFAAPAFGPDGLIVVGNFGHTLYGLDSSGVTKWQYTVETGNFASTVLIQDEIILAPSSDDYLYALDLNGNFLWKFETGNMLWAQPASDGTLVYLPGLDHKLYAINLRDGKEAWNIELESALLSGPILTEDGNLFLATMEGEVVAINVKTKDIRWRRSTEGRIWSSPALFEDTLYVGNAANKVFAISASDGSVIWTQDVGSPVIGGAVVYPEGVAFPTEGGNLVAWDLKGEKQQWTKPIGGKLYSTPVVVGDQLVAAVTEGDKLLQAFTLNGQESWAFTLPK